MAKYIWKEGKLEITLGEKDDSPIDLVFDPAQTNDGTRKAAECFGFQTALRNSTAGKMDDYEDAKKALLARAKVFTDTGWKSESDGKTKLELSDSEQAEVIATILVSVKQANGDKGDRADILKRFEALPDEKKAEVLASIKPAIDKGFKQKLREKRQAGKVKVADF